MLSAYNDLEGRTAGIEAGAVDFIPKPFQRSVVLARARTHVRLHKARRSLVEIQLLNFSRPAPEQQPSMPRSEFMKEAGCHLRSPPSPRDAGDFCQVIRGSPHIYDYIVADVCATCAKAEMKASNICKIFRENSFFRDTSPFEMIKFKVLPDLIDKRSKAARAGGPIPIRVWSAACSTGQEVYSTAIAMQEVLIDLSRYDVRILGTDISDKAVAHASYGHYSKLELDRGMAADKMARYFVSEGQMWKVRDEIRAMATFKTMNLLDPFALPNKFDIIFCRNVAIYFSEPDRIRLFKSISRAMAPDDYLIIGSTESITGISTEFEAKRHLRSVFYQLKNGA